VELSSRLNFPTEWPSSPIGEVKNDFPAPRSWDFLAHGGTPSPGSPMRRGVRWSLHNRVSVNGGASVGMGKTYKRGRSLRLAAELWVPEVRGRDIEKSGTTENLKT
jgi:hypothetical protein